MPKKRALRLLTSLISLGLSGCWPIGAGGQKPGPVPVDLAVGFGPATAIALDTGQSVATAGPLVLAGSRNETLGFAVRIDSVVGIGGSVRFVAPTQTSGEALSIDAATFGQVLPLPVDLNRASFVRQSGLTVEGADALPRAIVPLTAGDHAVALSACRPTPTLDGTLLWIDLPIPTAATPGAYLGAIEVIDATGKTTIARVPINLVVHDLVLPDQRNLRLLGEVTWDSLTRHFANDFEAVTPKLMNRTDPRYRRSTALLDSLVALAQRHRLTLSVDRLQPTAKWNPPSVEWRDFDSLVGPWLDGSAFADKEPLGLWPLPGIDFLSNYPAAAQREYYANAAAHFDSKDWLSRAPVWLRAEAGGPADVNSGPGKRRLLERAGGVLAAHPRVRVALPLTAEQIEFNDTSGIATLPRRSDDERLMTASTGLIFNTPIQAATPRRAPLFLRTELAGPVPYAGAGGDERDVRAWAWLAYTRDATIVRFDSVLPAAVRATERADPAELVWFYPGQWFGVDQPVASLQLKWLRRAEQDYEYLALADQRGQRINARLMARLLTKPVQIQPAQRPNPTYALMTGTADQRVWDAGMSLLARTILIRPPGQQPDVQAQERLNIETLAWIEPQEKPLVLPRSTVFSPGENGTVDVRVGVDLYNASDTTPTDNSLGFSQVPRGWTIDPQPQRVPPLATYQVVPMALRGTINPDAVDARRRAEVSMTYTGGQRRRTTPAPMVVPAAVTRRHEGNVEMDGSLEDWTDDDALCLGPLVRMLDRPTLQRHTLSNAPTPSSIFSAWSEGNFYLAFKVSGLTSTPLMSAQNFVRYDFRRAWGEDIVQLIVQAVYADGTLGPVVHIACKPNGGLWSDRKLDLREGADEAWEPLESGARYACTVDKGDWRGEVAIPWRAIHPPGYVDGPDRLPVMLRFNFAQHQHATGTSASWAGPVDQGRDDTFTGVLVLRNLEGR